MTTRAEAEALMAERIEQERIAAIEQQARLARAAALAPTLDPARHPAAFIEGYEWMRQQALELFCEPEAADA